MILKKVFLVRWIQLMRDEDLLTIKITELLSVGLVLWGRNNKLKLIFLWCSWACLISELTCRINGVVVKRNVEFSVSISRVVLSVQRLDGNAGIDSCRFLDSVEILLVIFFFVVLTVQLSECRSFVVDGETGKHYWLGSVDFNIKTINFI